MATIEPRLIHLLNKSPSPDQHQSFIQPLSSSLSLPPIDHDTGTQRGLRASQQHIPSFSSINDATTDGVASRPADRATDRHDATTHHSDPRPYSLDLLLQDPEPIRLSHTHSILNESPDAVTDGTTKKRQRNLIVKDDFVQLPQPLKKQKSAQTVMPPIIIGLYSPPEDAGVFPPMQCATGSFHEAEASGDSGGRPHTLRRPGYEDRVSSYLDSEVGEEPREDIAAKCQPHDRQAGTSQAGKKRKVTKQRRPWTEEESRTLLLGVKKHGKGNWTKILEDSEFTFNRRNPTDLKDRWRSICPEELKPSARSAAETKPEHFPNTRKVLPLDMILVDDEQHEGGEKASSSSTLPKSQFPAKRKTGPRSHRKDIEELRQLGIDGPLKESGRRKRTLFSDQDDREILEGLELHGPQWTLIRNDPRFNLSGRRPTDLRDRIRNKHPDVFERICKQRSEGGRTNNSNVLEPSVNTSAGGRQILEPSLNRRTSKESMPTKQKEGLTAQLPLLASSSSTADYSDTLPSISNFEISMDTLPPISNFDMAIEHSYSSGMDISRLRLSGDDTQVGSGMPNMLGPSEEPLSSRWLPQSSMYSEDQHGHTSRPSLADLPDTGMDTGSFKLPPRQRSLSPTSRSLTLPAFHGFSTNSDVSGLRPLRPPKDSSGAENHTTHRSGPFHNILH